MVNKSAVSLALGFIGSSEVNNKTSLSLVADFIKGHRRANPKSDVTFVILAQPFTQTLVDLADYALANGHDLVIVANVSEIEGGESAEAIESFTRVEGVITLPVEDGGEEIARTLVGSLMEHGEEQRLILVDDPSSDDGVDAYEGLLAAHEAGIVTRSLLDGLDRVFFEGEEETLPDDDDDTEEVATDDEEDGDVPDLEDLEGGVDDDEIKEYDDDSTEPAEEPEPEPAPVKKVAAKKAAAPVKAVPAKKVAPAKAAAPAKGHTEASLLKYLEEQGVEAFYALAAEYGVFPGKGVKKPVMIQRILKAIGGDAEPAAAAPAPAKKAAAPVKAAPVKKAAPAKVAAPKRPPVPTAPPSSDLETRVENIEKVLRALVTAVETLVS